MLKIAAERYIKVGQLIAQMQTVLDTVGQGDDFLVGQPYQMLISVLKGLKTECDELSLPEPSQLLAKHIQRLSSRQGSHGLYELATVRALVDDIFIHLKTQLFLYVLPHRSTYYEYGNAFKERLTKSFPNASKELARAGKCYAVEEDTSCVFHSMRAAEIGLRTFARYLRVHPPRGIKFAQWGEILGAIDVQLGKIRNSKKTRTIEAKITFCSDALAHFRNCKDAYRNQVAHARVTYEGDQAKDIMEGTTNFLDSLAVKLSEPKTQ
jgi:hypothetical protein